MISSSDLSYKKVLSNSTIFFDNNALIGLLNKPELLNFFLDLRTQGGCEFLTIPSVVIEFARTDDISNYNERMRFIDQIFTVYPIEKHIDPRDPELFLFNKVAKCSIVDLLLYMTLYKFQNAYLFTENHKDFHTALLDRKSLVTIDDGSKQIRNYAFYTLNTQKMETVTRSILTTVTSR